GTYTMKVMKQNHVTREYTVTVSAENVTQDVKIHLLGDINGDGRVNTSDVGKANSHAKGTATLTGYDFACADVNGDGKVNTSDVGKLNSHAKGTKKLW
nr:dockerin type I repeat-containing protein [bacterium]